MKIHSKTIDYYINRLRRNQYFSLAGYSDAEWYCIMGKREGELTALGQRISAVHGLKLLEVLRRRQYTPNFLFAIPCCLQYLPSFEDGEVRKFLFSKDINIECYERDSITDSLAEDAGLFPLIKQLHSLKCVIIGNKHLRGLSFLGYAHFIEVSSPNLHLEEGGIEKAVSEALTYGEPAVYLISAGVSAAIIADRLHDEIPNSFFIDCGSIWDAFVGIGQQREWRAKLYSDPKKMKEWRHANLFGKD